MDLTPTQALRLRMASLLLAPYPTANGVDPGEGAARAAPGSVADVVTWFGAMQAQDLGSAMWSLGARLPGFTAADVHDALERREALRTWPMRGTVHLVPPRDVRWMLDLMGARALAGAAARRAYLGLTEEVANRAVDVLGAALAGGGRLTRAQCLDVLTEAGIDGAGQLRYHLLWYASQSGVTCIAPDVDGQQTFVLLDEWAPEQTQPSRDEALATIAVRYFRSHGPTTHQDLAGWTGLPVSDVKRGIAAAGDALASVLVEGRVMYLDPALLDASGPHGDTAAQGCGDEVLALPGFDEFMLGFKDRALMLDEDHKQAVVPGGNGMFQPTLVRGGRVVGTWRRTTLRTRTRIDVLPLVRLAADDRRRVEAAFVPYARYVDRPVEVRWPP